MVSTPDTPWKHVFAFFTEVYAIWLSERPAQLAAALAYYSMFAFAPVIYVVFVLAGLFIDTLAAADQFYAQIVNILGTETADAIFEMVWSVANANRSDSLLVSVVGFLTLFYAASGLFFQMQYMLNMIWRVPPPSKGHTLAFVTKRLVSFLMVIGVSLLLVFSALLNFVLTWFGNIMQFFFGFTQIPLFLTWLAQFGLLVLAFVLVYKFLPDVKITWRDVLPGAGLAALLIMLAGLLATLFFQNISLGSAFGAAAVFAVFLMVINFIAQIFLLGAVISRVYSHRYGSQKPALDEAAMEASANYG